MPRKKVKYEEKIENVHTIRINESHPYTIYLIHDKGTKKIEKKVELAVTVKGVTSYSGGFREIKLNKKATAYIYKDKIIIE